MLRFDSILGTPRAALNEDDDGDNNSTEDEIHIFREDYVVIIDDENDPCREDDIIITIIIDDDDENCPSILEGFVDSGTDSETDNADTKSGNAKRGANENHADDAENRRRFRNESENISELLETTATRIGALQSATRGDGRVATKSPLPPDENGDERLFFFERRTKSGADGDDAAAPFESE